MERRRITDHLVQDDANRQLIIITLDQPDQAGTNHEYLISWKLCNDRRVLPDGARECYIIFQHGSVRDFGVNGVTEEAMLAIVIDRLRSFQSSNIACHENAMALSACENALGWLQSRSQDKTQR